MRSVVATIARFPECPGVRRSTTNKLPCGARRETVNKDKSFAGERGLDTELDSAATIPHRFIHQIAVAMVTDEKTKITTAGSKPAL